METEVPRMDPRLLLLLLYAVILQELLCGWMELQRQRAKPKKQAGPLWSASFSRCRSVRPGFSRPLVYSLRRERLRDWRKAGRIIRKA